MASSQELHSSQLTEPFLVLYWEDLKSLTDQCETLSPLLVESVLLALLASEIRADHGVLLQPSSGGPDPDDRERRPIEGNNHEKPHWSFKKQLLPKNTSDDLSLAIEDEIDYVLWYGHCFELETNLIVMKSKSPESQSSSLLHNMGRIHRARKVAGRSSILYGIMIDGRTWTFIHISGWSQYTKRIFDWDSERDQIVAQVWEIIKQAIDLFKTKILPRLALPSSTAQSLGGCRFEDIPDDICESNEDSYDMYASDRSSRGSVGNESDLAPGDMPWCW
ncbi:unnamed protein product [Penicillium olsonii]|nr:unnamed protein product [Penicillium olsonii]